ncbi:hypothetical protein HNO92_002975 [Chromobacterium alkanivorans]|uniref:restriction endonuclease n=1 Tax=Chromobacterium alkanivorans TaxID=1071719 RepID=UPI002167DE5E|nr:restriction endonuclease [Chromobacterium alkanivorans]MCS3803739.1 hypothetical protein [Chromobacterium alkanivorans]MCS3818156.1 hypothetical protein [Chromobacterium alkanivorans]MCS3874645.1 hypothetical protein [Chromobacterium alkanivorans]
MIDWRKISSVEFEELCYELMELNGFKNIKWYGKGGGDKGRDLTADKYEEPIGGIQKHSKWIVQCKRYIAASITKSDIDAFLCAAREHSPNSVLIILTGTLSSNVKDWIDIVRREYRFEIYTWEEKDLQREIARHRKSLRIKVEVIPTPGEVTLFYDMPPSGKTYMCDVPGLEELGFYIMNDYGSEQNARWLNKLVEYIRHNEIDFYVEDDEQ